MARKRLTAILLGLLSAGMLSGCYFLPQEEAMLDPPEVKVDTVEYMTYKAAKKDITKQSINTGSIVSSEQFDLYYENVSGAIKTIYVSAGEMVEKGQLVAELETGNLANEIDLQSLYTQKAQLKYNTAVSSGASESEIQSAKLDLQIEQSKYDQLQEELAQSRLIAPVSGQVSFAERLGAGEWVNAYRTLVTIIDPDKLQIELPVETLSNFPLGMEVILRYDKVIYDGIVAKTPLESPELLEKDTTNVYFDFVGEAPNFASVGKIADVIVVHAKRTGVIVIPKNMVRSFEDRRYVYLLENGEKVERDVTLGIDNATEIEIVEGLKEGEIIIVR
ncbi:MAG TPA: efflux RND transporter periplasmic adaptor subunit [Oscillospiraceae bacterium]|nr:efflux RND transporter periplasmic adaptor subunit [Oscillospiraceae bacterium]